MMWPISHSGAATGQGLHGVPRVPKTLGLVLVLGACALWPDLSVFAGEEADADRQLQRDLAGLSAYATDRLTGASQLAERKIENARSRRGATDWIGRVKADYQRALSQDSAKESMIQTWILTEKIIDYLSRGDGRATFGDGHPAILRACRAILIEVEGIAEAYLPAKSYASLDKQIAEHVKASPLEGTPEGGGVMSAIGDGWSSVVGFGESALTGIVGIPLIPQRTIKGIDRIVTRLFAPVRFFYTRPALLIYAALAVVGTICFAHVLNSARYSILETRDSYALGVLVFLAIDVFVILLHEGSHAFAVKAFGREVVRGGFMMYLGMPAFFVDTSDIWMEGRLKRIAVSAAGPASELVIASLLSIFMLAFPDCPANWLLFRIAFFFYLGVVLNLNPLLELDGYYILMDLLEMPNLRKRSLAFVKETLPAKLARRQKFSREEIIREMVSASGITDYLTLTTLAELKKSTPRYRGPKE